MFQSSVASAYSGRYFNGRVMRPRPRTVVILHDWHAELGLDDLTRPLLVKLKCWHRSGCTGG
jgi:hypothetical protein